MPTNDDIETTSDELRVRSWDEYVGQEALKANLDKRIRASKITGRPLDHILLAAPPGYGKTSLAGCIAGQIGAEYWFVKMPVTTKEFAVMLEAMPRPALFLLDEIHSATKAMQEALLPVIEEGFFQNKVGRIIPTEGITFVAATTEPAKLIKPLVDRFRLKPHFVDYTDEELGQIITTMGRRIGVNLDPTVVQQIAPAAAFTPRLAGALVTAARDLEAIGDEVTAESILDLTGLDPDGLTHGHIAYLKALDSLEGISGSRNLCSVLQASAPQLEDLERLLIRRKLITLESQGRTITGAGMTKIGVRFNARSAA